MPAALEVFSTVQGGRKALPPPFSVNIGNPSKVKGIAASTHLCTALLRLQLLRDGQAAVIRATIVCSRVLSPLCTQGHQNRSQ